MKSAEEWAKEIPAATECCTGKINGRRCDCISTLDCDLEMSAIAQIIRAAQRDAIEVALGAVQGLRGAEIDLLISMSLPVSPESTLEMGMPAR